LLRRLSDGQRNEGANVGLGIRKDDTILVISGDEKGKKGRVLDVLSKDDRVIVERINMVKRHMKPSKKYSQGGIIEKEAPVRRSNVMLVCPKCDKATKLEPKLLKTGKKSGHARNAGR
jgi:large subunit ribosomal protein L24